MAGPGGGVASCLSFSSTFLLCKTLEYLLRLTPPHLEDTEMEADTEIRSGQLRGLAEDFTRAQQVDRDTTLHSEPAHDYSRTQLDSVYVYQTRRVI